MEDTPKTSASQAAKALCDFTTRQVAEILNRNPKWVKENRDLFRWYTVPGRGSRGEELRFVRTSVAEYVERLRATANRSSQAAEHETVEQIITRVKRERAAAGQSL